MVLVSPDPSRDLSDDSAITLDTKRVVKQRLKPAQVDDFRGLGAIEW